MYYKIKKTKDYASQNKGILQENDFREKLDSTDPLDVQSRIIDFGKKSDFRGEMYDVIDIAEITCQYIRWANKNMKQRLDKVKQLKFDKIPSLEEEPIEYPENILKLQTLPIDDLALPEITQLLDYHYLSYNEAKENLEITKKKLIYFINEKRSHEKSIKKLNEKMQLKNKERSQITKKELDKSLITAILYEELTKLKRFEPEKISETVNALAQVIFRGTAIDQSNRN